MNDQRTLWPGYVYPSIWDLNTPWLQFSRYAQQGRNRTGSIAIMNPDSGPGTAPVPDYTGAVNYARNNGHRVIGYVHTSYGDRSMLDVITEIEKYYLWYGIDGILLDEMSNDLTDASYYRVLYAYVKTVGNSGTTLVVGNPGAAATTDWQIKNSSSRSADILVIHENTASAYLTWTPPAWTTNYPPAKFAHLIHGCSVSDFNTVLTRTKTLRAGFRYITDDVMSNPWDTLKFWPQQATP
jgi:hypothetical protein